MSKPVLTFYSLDGLGGGLALRDGVVSRLSEMISSLGRISMLITLIHLLGTDVKLAI